MGFTMITETRNSILLLGRHVDVDAGELSLRASSVIIVMYLVILCKFYANMQFD